MRRLVIAEKGSAALRLAVVLSDGSFQRRRLGVTVFTFPRDGIEYSVIGLRGHIVELDYPESFRDWDSVALDDLLAAEPIERVEESRIADALRTLAAEADEAWIATDYDREGELIGLEALRIVRAVRPDVAAKRVRFSALTKWEIEAAFQKPTEVDEWLAASARAREEVDLAWGAVLTRFLSLACGMRGRDFLSVGRVQTPTLGLLVERERELEEFQPTPYWILTATLDAGTPVRASHAHGPFWRRDEADAAQGRAELATDVLVLTSTSRTIEGRRPPPFNTTTFLAEATRLGLGAARAMTIAEDLYRGGYISYPRTDNTVYPRSLNLRAALERLLDSDLASDASAVLAQERIRPSRGPLEATDHPPIYPTSGARKADLKADRWRVYELVARRFLATLAPPAVERAVEATFDLGGEHFVAKARQLVELGWRAYYGQPFVATDLPPLEVGAWLPVLAVTSEAKATEPPPRYTQGHVIEAMEQHGLGTKSTRHEVVQKLYDRGYVEGRRLRVTAQGRAVVEALEAYGGQVARPEMTAGLERAMDTIARGEREPDDVVAESRSLLAAALVEMRGHEAGIATWVRTAIADETEVGPCEKCGGTMVVRRARTGRRFLGCSNFPACRNTRNVPAPGFVVPAQETCDRCGSRKVARIHRGVVDLLCVSATCAEEDLTEILGV